jgi:hypothetical protein
MSTEALQQHRRRFQRHLVQAFPGAKTWGILVSTIGNIEIQWNSMKLHGDFPWDTVSITL